MIARLTFACALLAVIGAAGSSILNAEAAVLKGYI